VIVRRRRSPFKPQQFSFSCRRCHPRSGRLVAQSQILAVRGIAKIKALNPVTRTEMNRIGPSRHQPWL
jgi:hypothetical protein